MATEAAALWAFALRVYARPGVQPACLALQDGHGRDVLLLLWAAWLGGLGHRLTAAEAAGAEAALAPWREAVVRPLRAVRRGLKAGPPPAPSPATEALRDRVKAAELEAERLGLDLLAGLVAPRRADGSAAANLALVAPEAPAGLLEVLAEAAQAEAAA
ncbi:MAG TPA: TIGR02444 family protein [Alphaproteobacteria bacterium]|nr:TIGR02444 family protein [Alphaproteobacteria bacterium]